MTAAAEPKDTCIQTACFFLPFFESGEWRRKEKSPWKTLSKRKDATPENVRDLASYTAARMARSADCMEYLLSLHGDWKITPKKDGIWMETATLPYEKILPKLLDASFSADDYLLYAEYTRKWGML